MPSKLSSHNFAMGLHWPRIVPSTVMFTAEMRTARIINSHGLFSCRPRINIKKVRIASFPSALAAMASNWKTQAHFRAIACCAVDSSWMCRPNPSLTESCKMICAVHSVACLDWRLRGQIECQRPKKWFIRLNGSKIELTSVNPARARSQLNRLVTFQLLTKRRKKKIKPRTVSVHETARIRTGRLVAMLTVNRRINWCYYRRRCILCIPIHISRRKRSFKFIWVIVWPYRSYN